jgi:membrane-associated phospholipid phosphatase
MLMRLSPGRERLATGAALAVLLTTGFYAIDHYMAIEADRGRIFWRPATALDDMIPFAPGWVWIYFLYFPMCFVPLGLKALWHDLLTFRRIAIGFALQFITASLVFWLAPSQMLRPHVYAIDASTRALAWFYQIDPGFNVFPSLHVANATYVACLVTRFASRRSALAAWITVVLIAASTVLVKQHYVADIPFGMLLGLGSYHVAFFAGSRSSRITVTLTVPHSPYALPRGRHSSSRQRGRLVVREGAQERFE